jgi:isopropylmalate/homocitrate/citramalate synthase
LIDRTKVWTGTINDDVVREGAGKRIGLYDTTLRDGEQTVGVVLTPEQKLEIARLLDRLVVDRIEVGFPRVSEDDRRAIELIRDAGLRAELWGFSRAVPDDVQAIVELGLPATVIEAPVSDLKLDALGVARSKMLGRIESAVAAGSEAGIRVAFFGVDGSRADPEFLGEVYRTAIGAGAKEIVVVDTLGIASPDAVYAFVTRMREEAGAAVPVHWHGHDDFGLATAGAIAAVKAGAQWLHGTVNGMGERAGNANLPEIALTLEALYGYETGLDLAASVEVSRRVRELCGYELAPWTPLVGENLFRRETGAVAAQFHDPPAIEPYSSELVGAERGIVLGKRSGVDSIRIKAEELGLDVPEERRRDLLAEVKALAAEKRDLVSDEEFRELVLGSQRSGDSPALDTARPMP